MKTVVFRVLVTIAMLAGILGMSVPAMADSSLGDVGITKTVDNPTPNEGEIVIFTLTVTNNQYLASGVTVLDVLPAGLTFISADKSNFEPSTGIWRIGYMSINASTTLKITTSVDQGTAGTTLTNTATVSSTSTDSNPDNNQASASVTPIMVKGIKIIKTTNGIDSNSAPGQNIAVGAGVTWTYKVSNTGNVPLSNITVTDDQGVVPVYLSGDEDGDSKLDTNETWVYTATGLAQPGQYTNIGTADGTAPDLTIVTANNPDNYFGMQARIILVKLTNDADQDTIPGLNIASGSPVTWTYRISNDGNVPLSNIIVTDDQGVTPVYQSGDNGNHILDTFETWIYTAEGTAVEGQYTNLGTVKATAPDNSEVTDSNPDNYFGAHPGINIIKMTNGTDNDAAPGPTVLTDSPVIWTYTVTNTGNVPLSGISVRDNMGVTPVYQSGNDNNDGNLDINETWVYQATGNAVAGQYSNIGIASGTAPDGITTVTATNPDNYFGEKPGNSSNPAINIIKTTNGADNDGAPGLYIPAGSPVTWTYTVTNPGDVPLSNIMVTDNQTGVNPLYLSGDIDNIGYLDTDETWIYTASGDCDSRSVY